MKEKTAQILSTVENLKQKVTEVLPESASLTTIDRLIEDLNQDNFMVAVVGEFKNGKSTFVNALLEQEIMPVDVTPVTATINVVNYSEQPALHVLKPDGGVEEEELNLNALEKYTASADFNLDDINYLQLYMPSLLLKNRVALIDTPGVNDLNQHRSDVTYEFIPRADVILFMMNLTAPVKGTEVDFLEEKLLKQDTERIVYIANFADLLDEDEISETLDYMKGKIQKVTGYENPMIFPLSAKEALQGKLEKNEELVNNSGIEAIEKELMKRTDVGARVQEKLTNYEFRLKEIYSLILLETNEAIKIAGENTESLNEQLETIKCWADNTSQWQQQVTSYLDDKGLEINYMVKKSIGYFGDRLKGEVINQIQMFHGSNIKQLIESQLPQTIRYNIKRWVEQYSDSVQDLLRKLETEISKGLSSAFKKSIDVRNSRSELSYDALIPTSQVKTGNSSVKAGLILGGTGMIALLLGGGLVIPLIGMAGLPFLREKISDIQLKNIKPQLQMEIEKNLDSLLDDFQSHIEKYVEDEIGFIRQHTLDEFTKAVQYQETITNKEILRKKEAGEKERKSIKDLTQFKAELLNGREELEKGEKTYERV